MIRRALLLLSLGPFAVVACREGSVAEPVTPVVLAPASAEPAGPVAGAATSSAKPFEGDPGAPTANASGVGAVDTDPGPGEGIGLANLGTFGRLGSNSGGRPSVRPGAMSVNGRLPPEVIQRIVRQNFGRFRLCYENGLRSNPKLAGEVVARFTIDRGGNTVSVKDAGSSMPDAAVLQCVLRGFGHLVYPQPDSGIVVVTFPVLFEPSDAAPAAAGSTAPAKSAAPAMSGSPPPPKKP